MNEVCELCRTPFDAGGALKTGRPRKFCTDACRQAAYRARRDVDTLSSVVTAPLTTDRQLYRPQPPAFDAPPRTAAPQAGTDEILTEILKDLQAGARDLMKCLATADGEEPLRRVARMQEQLDSLTAGMVGRARVQRTTWATIGKILGISQDTARHRFPDRVIERSLSRFSRIRGSAPGQGSGVKLRGIPLQPIGPQEALEEPTTGGGEELSEEPETATTSREPSGAAYNRLAPVLSMLVRSARLTNKDVSAKIGCSPSYLSRILSGERVPTWRLTQKFARACGADPDVLRKVWETERLSDRMRDPELPQEDDHLECATVRLRTALGTLHMKAGQPAPYDIVVASHWTLAVPEVAALLDADEIPAWRVVEPFVRLLAGDTGYFKDLWEKAHAELAQEYRHREDEVEDTHGMIAAGPNRLDSVMTVFGGVFRQENFLESGRARLLARFAERSRNSMPSSAPGMGQPFRKDIQALWRARPQTT
ncbi:helix-turn-helix domain-containing protein [Streptomyces lavendulae]|uniref:helix-turn-helix domain-containing protein n=1 Tax=Streptomyces lavendulae TaxID=1914 RepID=UPI00369DF190